MPLEIRELVIRVTVNEDANSRLDENILDRKLKEMEARIIDQFLEQVSDKLEKRDER